MLQGEESLARHITREHGGRQPDDVADGELATIPPPPTTGDATVDGVVSDNWHAIVSDTGFVLSRRLSMSGVGTESCSRTN